MRLPLWQSAGNLIEVLGGSGDRYPIAFWVAETFLLRSLEVDFRSCSELLGFDTK